MTIQHVPSKGRISIIKFQNFTIQRRQPVIRLVYGFLLVVIAIIMVIIDPIEIFTEWKTQIKNDSYIMRMWENPTYKLYADIYVFNYTNVPEYMAGTEKTLRVEEVGPFHYQELRTNENITINEEDGTLTIMPKIVLKFLPEESIDHTKNVKLYLPNIALIAISTVAADHLPYLANSGLYLSAKTMGSNLFNNMNVHEFFWGFKDPVVTVAHKLFPGWIDFDSVGLLDRFYAESPTKVVLEMKDEKRRYSINSWGGLGGIPQQGFTNLNSSTLCNRIKGSYEGLMISPRMTRDKIIPLYRRQACRIFPLTYVKDMNGYSGLNYYRYEIAKNAFSKSSPFACNCTSKCLPEGFVDISGCYYGFPIALSKPHFMDVDPEQASYFTGMHPDPEKHTTKIDVEPTLGVPLSLYSKIQVNMAVRTSAGNPITSPLKDKVLPLVWLQMYCKEPPADVIELLRLRLIIGPPVVITIEVLLFLVGFCLGVQGAYRLMRPKYKLKEIRQDSKVIRRTSIRRTSLVINIAENKCFRESDETEAVSLLGDPRELQEFISRS
ncbi:scavenger receptor class B member 1-like [Leguminivora glycinivorella]|uniref:scavenger receptor class B member 1-like n=1 Tax=Leguminivora glycinivorella TaxID=1035111 RepID=UPI0020105CF0|nr:scavenger receptor class B member 1-like [Leguminivora glycinivorella]